MIGLVLKRLYAYKFNWEVFKKCFALHTGIQELKTCSRTEFINNQHLLNEDFSKLNTEIELELYEWDKDLVIPIKKISSTHFY